MKAKKSDWYRTFPERQVSERVAEQIKQQAEAKRTRKAARFRATLPAVP